MVLFKYLKQILINSLWNQQLTKLIVFVCLYKSLTFIRKIRFNQVSQSDSWSLKSHWSYHSHSLPRQFVVWEYPEQHLDTAEDTMREMMISVISIWTKQLWPGDERGWKTNKLSELGNLICQSSTLRWPELLVLITMLETCSQGSCR